MSRHPHGHPPQPLRQPDFRHHPANGPVGILAAAYILIVKPVLHTTDEAINSSGIDQIAKTIRSVNHDVQREIRHSFSATGKKGANPQKLIHCIQRADNNVAKIQRCTVRF